MTGFNWMFRPRTTLPGRLPDPMESPFISGPMAGLVLRPWMDSLTLKSIAGFFMPLSRGWAAALEAGEDVARFVALTGNTARPAAIARALRDMAERTAAWQQAEVAWQQLFFGNDMASEAACIAAELARQESAERLMWGRGALMPLHMRHRFARTRWEIPTIDTVEARHGARLDGTVAPFAVPESVTVQASLPVQGAMSRIYWLRYPGADGRTAWARVYEPLDAVDPPTLIYLHGIAVENEMLRDFLDPINSLVRQGIRVIRSEAPSHGRRREPGWYAGETVMGRAPLGQIDLLPQWSADIAVLIDWSRRHGDGLTGIGGTSLGALTSQLLASASADWPARLRPDALLLVVTSGDIVATAFEGTLARSVGLQKQLHDHGWSHEQLIRWRPLLEPGPAIGLAPENIVMLLGNRDEVTPFSGGLALARRWNVPAENLFVRPQGHFSGALGLANDGAPLERFAALLKG